MAVSNLKEFALLSNLRAYLPDEALFSHTEVTALERLGSTIRTVRRGSDIIVHGRAYDSLFVLAEGFALRYRILVDGRRQALNVSIPGDTIGYPAYFFETAPYSVSALSNAVIYVISFADIATILRDHLRVALAMFCVALIDGIQCARPEVQQRCGQRDCGCSELTIPERMRSYGEAVMPGLCDINDEGHAQQHDCQAPEQLAPPRQTRQNQRCAVGDRYVHADRGDPIDQHFTDCDAHGQQTQDTRRGEIRGFQVIDPGGVSRLF